jgi:hypothetical protein
VGPVNTGDLLVARIQGVGELRVSVSGPVGAR